MPKRRPNQLRPVKITRHYPTAAPGSVLIEMGQTRVLCTATLSTTPPNWLPRDPNTGQFTRGWVTAEYNMLPGSTPDRQKRGPNSRATEIQRLIGRSLRAAVNLEKLPGVAITCDCDVLQADGGTRTASITGAYVALADALAFARRENIIHQNPILGPVAAVSVGLIDAKPYLDLDYALDSNADVDLNVVMNHRRQFIEIQGTGEQTTFTRKQLDTLLNLASRGITKLLSAQRKALAV
ncbi:MAG: ribonuclease PH [Planctomycetes bacterium]|nr:ribonuclease PH [Planctomycetota bacterium]